MGWCQSIDFILLSGTSSWIQVSSPVSFLLRKTTSILGSFSSSWAATIIYSSIKSIIYSRKFVQIFGLLRYYTKQILHTTTETTMTQVKALTAFCHRDSSVRCDHRLVWPYSHLQQPVFYPGQFLISHYNYHKSSLPFWECLLHFLLPITIILWQIFKCILRGNYF